jgi:hypothetical protein
LCPPETFVEQEVVVPILRRTRAHVAAYIRYDDTNRKLLDDNVHRSTFAAKQDNYYRRPKR